MASGIEFFTGFEGCGSVADLTSLLDGVSGTVNFYSSGGYNDGKRVNIYSEYGYIQKNCTPSKTKCFGFHLINAGILDYDGNPSRSFVHIPQCGDVRFYNTNAGLDIRKGSTQIGLASGVVIPNTLTHVEVKIFSDASAGTIEIKINGDSVISLTGLDTNGSDIDYIRWKGRVGDDDISYDNVFIASNWQGELVSLLIKPSSDSASQFAPSAGTDNYAMVDDSAQDGDGTYVDAGTVGYKDLYGYEDIPAGYSPKAVTLVTVARKDDSGDRGLTPVVKHDSTEYDQPETTLSTAYPAAASSGAYSVLDAAPDSTEWTVAKVNALEAGFKVST